MREVETGGGRRWGRASELGPAVLVLHWNVRTALPLDSTCFGPAHRSRQSSGSGGLGCALPFATALRGDGRFHLRRLVGRPVLALLGAQVELDGHVV